MEGPKLTQHEVIKFLTLKGGRCTNFELVSNFRDALNHPQHQADARLRFKDIVNRVANVGEYQNVKYIELKREYSDNNLPAEFTPLQPSSFSPDCGSSYTSPLTQTQNFQPYWRYRLSTSTKVPTLPVRSPNYETQGKTADSSSHLGRSISESTLSESVSDIRPPPRTRGRSASGFNRSISANPAEKSTQDPVPILRKSSFYGEEYLSRRSSINGYPPSDINSSMQNYALSQQQKLPNQNSSGSVDARRNSEVFTSERHSNTQWPPKPVSEYSLSHSQSFSGCHGNSAPVQGTQNISSNNLDRWRNDRSFIPRNGTERSPKRAGICNDDILRELEEDAAKQYILDSPITRNFNRLHGLKSENQDTFSQGTEDNTYSSLPDYSCNYSQLNKPLYQSEKSHRNLENQQYLDVSHQYQRNGPEGVKGQLQNVNSNIFPSNNSQDHTIVRTSLCDNNGSLDDSNSEYETASLCSSNYEREQFIAMLEKGNSGIESQADYGHVGNNVQNHDRTPPVPPERRRKQSRTIPETPEESNSKPQQEVLPNSTGKVKDRVQHFDGLEKKRTYPKSGSAPLQDKENRSSKINLMEDDVSISALDPKLKREWYVKAAQGDYYALVGLLKKEPKLAAIKDIATGTALHWGAKHGDANIIKLIAGTYRVNPNIRSGYTPIHLATMYKHNMIVDLLVHTYGADASMRDYSGKRADQYPDNYIRTVAGLKTTERRPLKVRPLEKESSVSAFMRIGSLNLRKSRKSAVFASVRGRNWGSATELRLNNYKSTRKKNSKTVQPEKKCDTDSKNDSDSDSAYGFYSK